MPRTIRRKPILLGRSRRPLSAETLQMMLMSGVVRRADLNPPPAPQRYARVEQQESGLPQEAASERGWLSRIFLGRRPHAPAVNRS